MMGLMQEYGDKLDFVMLDVTTEDTTAQAAAKAKSLGLSSFFEANKKMTSTVAIFKGKKSVFKTVKQFKPCGFCCGLRQGDQITEVRMLSGCIKFR